VPEYGLVAVVAGVIQKEDRVLPKVLVLLVQPLDQVGQEQHKSFMACDGLRQAQQLRAV